MPRRALPVFGQAHMGRYATCTWKCGSACFRPAANGGGNEPFEAVVARVISRRTLLKGGLAAAVVLGTGCATGPAGSPRAVGGDGSLGFTPIEPGMLDDVVVPDGYAWEALIRWGEPILRSAPDFDFNAQTPQAQAGQFGYNCDYVAFLPTTGDEGVLWVNHEYTNSAIMLPGWSPQAPAREHVDIELAAIGGSVVAVRRGERGRWHCLPGHRLNRRITVETSMEITGPAAGAALLRTSEDPTGTRVRGTLNNCAGGMTPWGTVLTCEENIDSFFGNVEAVADSAVRALHDRFGFDGGPSQRRWELHHPRFDLVSEPNEPFRFGWVVEIDPTDPSFTPRKRTALGRFKHEGATPKIARDGRVAFYLGDDERFEYVYKFVTAGAFREGDREANLSLLDEGTLYVARFDAGGEGQGTGVWLPLVHGEGGLTAGEGFPSQAEVLINARGAADVLGATPMDRPEDIETHPVNGKVYAVFTKNEDRGADGSPGPDAANPRRENTGGHIIEITEDGDDAAATGFTWEIFLLCGDPDDPSTFFAGFPKDQVSPIATPDNLTFDAQGNLWIATDGQPEAIGFNDGYYAVPVEGDDRGHVRMFASVPRGAEAAGPAFSPDGATLFASIQHPGEDGSLARPLSDWPDRAQPPRPSVIAIWKEQGDARIGS
ncbi:MAG: PhoX family protein [Egibacteraceae bacterium]